MIGRRFRPPVSQSARDVRFQEGIELTGLGESEYGEASAALNDRSRQEWRPA
jgi:hypothetical protein